MRDFFYDLVASQPNSSGDYHGGGKYAKKVFLELAEQNSGDKWRILALYDSSKFLDAQIRDCAKDNGIELLDINDIRLSQLVADSPSGRLYTALPFGLLNHGFNELLNTGFQVYVTIHGLRTLEIPVPVDAIRYVSSAKSKLKLLARTFFEKKLYRRNSERFASLLHKTNVITVSNHTKYSILSHFPHINKQIEVFYSPDVTEFEDKTVDQRTEDLRERDYFLLISGNRWLKNNLRSITALDELFSEHPDLQQKVIITGVSNPAIFKDRIKNKDRFIFYKYVSDSLLRLLYERAFAFIYLSLNEGFGYPPIDAMKCGIPVIASPFTSIPEICGDAVLYTNPYSIPEIKNRILQLTDNRIYDEFSVKGKDRFAQISDRQRADLKACISHLLA